MLGISFYLSLKHGTQSKNCEVNMINGSEALQYMAAVLNGYEKKVLHLQAENARFRQDMTKLSNFYGESWEVRAIARAALKGGSDE